MTVDVRTEVVIERPPGEVAAYASDPTNAPHWYANIETAAWTTPPPLAVGSQLAFVARAVRRANRRDLALLKSRLERPDEH